MFQEDAFVVIDEDNQVAVLNQEVVVVLLISVFLSGEVYLSIYLDYFVSF